MLPSQQPLHVKCTKASISRRRCYTDFAFFYSYLLHVKNHTLRIIKGNVEGDIEVFKNNSSLDSSLGRTDAGRQTENRKKTIRKRVKQSEKELL